MTAISSIHFQKSTQHNIYHNDRTAKPNYLLKDGGLGIEVNRSAIDCEKLCNQYMSQAEKNYYERTHQKIQAKNIRWSAVVNIKEDTTMSDLEKLTKFLEEKYKFRCVQIAIHRDEGHTDKETQKTKINHHAHLEFFMLDERGINIFKMRDFNRKKMQEIQTEVAEILGMQRGEENSKKIRLNHREYKQHINEVKEQEQQIKKHQKEKEELKQELEKEKQKNVKQKFLTKKAVKERLEQERKAMKDKGFKAEDFRALNALNKSSFETQEDLEDAIKNLHEEIAKKRELEQIANVKQNQVKNLKDAYKSEVQILKQENLDLHNEIKVLKEQQKEQVQQEQTEQNKQIEELRDQLSLRDKQFLLTKIRINELERINKNLKEDLDKKSNDYDILERKLESRQQEISTHEKISAQRFKEIQSLKEENKQLKEENSKLKKAVEMYHKIVEICKEYAIKNLEQMKVAFKLYKLYKKEQEQDKQQQQFTVRQKSNDLER